MRWFGRSAPGNWRKAGSTNVRLVANLRRITFACACAAVLISCGRGATTGVSPAPAATASTAGADALPQIPPSDKAPPASQTGGFDGAQAYDYVAKLVSFGPRPPATDAIHRTQDYIRTQLKSFGCSVEEDAFHSQTPIGDVEMRNLVVKIPGTGPGIIVLLTHYDTARNIDNFVGADDAGSSTGVMLEIARPLCKEKQGSNAVWIGFLDGEEAQVTWSASDSVYGSRELAARMAVAGELKRIRALILADMVGQYNLQIPRESQSTKWLNDLIWNTAARLGYANVFVSQEEGVDDDHGPFLSRGVPSADIIEYGGYVKLGYWHTSKDTLDKVSPRSIAIVGHVILASVAELQQKFR
jgi:glutaminyl-peptide cyclotransferase